MIRLLLSAVATVLLIGAAVAEPQEDCYQAVLASSELRVTYPWPLPPDRNHARAVEVCSEVLRSAPNDDKAYFIRGQAYALGGGNLDQAIADYTRVIEINSGNANPWSPRVIAYLNRGIAYQNKGDQSRGLADINKAIELNPDYAPAYFIRGVAYEVAGDFGGDGDPAQNYPRAFADYAKAIEYDPNYVEVYMQRSKLHGKTGATTDRAVRASSDLDKALNIATAGAINPRYIIKNWFPDYLLKDNSLPAGEAK
jgi:tetratricopeptide (TPR) repeat protein